MKTKYRGYEIDVHRAEYIAGESLLYYSVFDETGCQIISDFTTSSDTVAEYVRIMKNRVDEEIEYRKR